MGSNIGNVLNQIALARIAFAQEGDIIRTRLWEKVSELPQDEDSVSRRVEQVIGTYKITPTLAAKLYENEITANLGPPKGHEPLDEPARIATARSKTIMRHVLRNLASGSTGNVRHKIEGAVIAADIGYNLDPLEDGRAPGFEYSQTPKNRPLLDLMIKAEHENPARFARAVAAAATSLDSGKNNERAELANLLEKDGHPMSAAVAKFYIGTGAPGRGALTGELPQNMRHYLTVMYADALATGQVEGFVQLLHRLSLEQFAESVEIKARVNEHLAGFKANTARGRGDNRPSPVPKVGAPLTDDERLNRISENFARDWTEIMEQAKAANKQAAANASMSEWLQRAKVFAKPVQQVGPKPIEPILMQPQQADDFLKSFYSSLVDPEQVERDRTRYLLAKQHIAAMDDDDPAKPGAIRDRDVLKEYLLRLYALQQALAGHGRSADKRENTALRAIADNTVAVAKAQQEGKSVVLLRDPIRNETRPVKLPPKASAPPQAPPPSPADEATTKLRSALDQTGGRARELTDDLAHRLALLAPELASLEKEQNQVIRRNNAKKFAYVSLTAAQTAADSHGDMRVIMNELRKALASEVSSVEAPRQTLAMNVAAKKAVLSSALTKIGPNPNSTVATADELLSLGTTLKAKDKAALIAKLPTNAKLAKWVADTTVDVGSRSGAGAGTVNVTEMYYVVNTISSVRYAMTEQQAAGGSARDAAKKKLGIDDATSVQPTPELVDTIQELERALFESAEEPDETLREAPPQHFSLNLGSVAIRYGKPTPAGAILYSFEFGPWLTREELEDSFRQSIKSGKSREQVESHLRQIDAATATSFK